MSEKFIVISKKKIVKILIGICLSVIMCVTCLGITNTVIEVGSKNRLLPIYSVETSKKQVALTFDCAWGADDIPSIIEVLNKNNVKATFFVVGDWVKQYPDAVQLLKNADMEIRKPYF